MSLVEREPTQQAPEPGSHVGRRGAPPGNSYARGNPGNRDGKRKARVITQALNRELDRVVRGSRDEEGQALAKVDELVRNLVREAIGGKRRVKHVVGTGENKKTVIETIWVPPAQWAVEMIFNRVEGSVKEKLEINDPDGILGRGGPSFTVFAVKDRESAAAIVREVGGTVVDAEVVQTEEAAAAEG